MRNLKRALSLTLASVMLLGMMVVGAGAAGYKDVTDDHNVEAIEVLQAVGAMVGDEAGNFDPDANVNRAQIATIMSRLLDLKVEDFNAADIPFTDVPEWAVPFVAACYADGITSGISATAFGSSNNVTAAQAALMMMKALGYFQYQDDFGDDWQLATIKQASEIGLFYGVTVDRTSPLTRNDVAQMALNALKSNMVAFTGEVGSVYEVNGQTIRVGYKPEYTIKTSADPIYNRIDNLATTIDKPTGQYEMQLGEYLYGGDLRLTADIDQFGRPARHWEFDGDDIGTYVREELLREQYTAGVTGRTVFDLLSRNIISDSELFVYVDGVLCGKGIDGTTAHVVKNDLVRSNQSSLSHTGRGVLTQVFYDSTEKEITISMINTYLAQATTDYNEKTGTISMVVYDGVNETEYTKAVDSEDVPEIEGLAAEDWFLVYMSGMDSSTLRVVDVFDVTILSDVEATRFETKDSDEVNNSKDDPSDADKIDAVTVDGTKYSTSKTQWFNEDVLDVYNDNRLVDKTYDLYLDQYGYAIGVDLHSGEAQYVFIAAYDMNGSNKGDRTASALAIFPDGTMDDIDVNVKATNKNIENDSTYAVELGTGEEVAKGVYHLWQDQEYTHVYGKIFNGKYPNANGNVENLWYSYSVNASGVYTLAPAKDFTIEFNNTATEDFIQTDRVSLQKSPSAVTDGDPDYNYASGNFGTVRSYGNDDSVYLTVDIDETNTFSNPVIDDVNGRYTGVQDVKLVYEPNAWVNAVVNSKGYVVAAVVLGEAEGVVDNYVYVKSGAYAEEKVGSDIFWDVDVIRNGVIETMRIKNNYDDTVRNLKINTIQELVLDPDGYIVKVRDVENDDTVYLDALDPTDAPCNTLNGNKVYDFHEYNKGNVEMDGFDVYFIDTAETVNKYLDGVSDISLVGRTLYLEEENDFTGLAIAAGAKAVLRQRVDNKTTWTEYADVASAYRNVADALENVSGKQFKGHVAAVLNSSGAAEWVVFYDLTPVGVNDPGYGTDDPAGPVVFTGTWTTINAARNLEILKGFTRANTYGVGHVYFELDAHPTTNNIIHNSNTLDIVYNVYVNGMRSGDRVLHNQRGEMTRMNDGSGNFKFDEDLGNFFNQEDEIYVEIVRVDIVTDFVIDVEDGVLDEGFEATATKDGAPVNLGDITNVAVGEEVEITIAPAVRSRAAGAQVNTIEADKTYWVAFNNGKAEGPFTANASGVLVVKHTVTGEDINAGKLVLTGIYADEDTPDPTKPVSSVSVAPAVPESVEKGKPVTFKVTSADAKGEVAMKADTVGEETVTLEVTTENEKGFAAGIEVAGWTVADYKEGDKKITLTATVNVTEEPAAGDVTAEGKLDEKTGKYTFTVTANGKTPTDAEKVAAINVWLKAQGAEVEAAAIVGSDVIGTDGKVIGTISKTSQVFTVYVDGKVFGTVTDGTWEQTGTTANEDRKLMVNNAGGVASSALVEFDSFGKLADTNLTSITEDTYLVTAYEMAIGDTSVDAKVAWEAGGEKGTTTNLDNPYFPEGATLTVTGTQTKADGQKLVLTVGETHSETKAATGEKLTWTFTVGKEMLDKDSKDTFTVTETAVSESKIILGNKTIVTTKVPGTDDIDLDFATYGSMVGEYLLVTESTGAPVLAGTPIDIASVKNDKGEYVVRIASGDITGTLYTIEDVADVILLPVGQMKVDNTMDYVVSYKIGNKTLEAAKATGDGSAVSVPVGADVVLTQENSGTVDTYKIVKVIDSKNNDMTMANGRTTYTVVATPEDKDVPSFELWTGVTKVTVDTLEVDLKTATDEAKIKTAVEGLFTTTPANQAPATTTEPTEVPSAGDSVEFTITLTAKDTKTYFVDDLKIGDYTLTKGTTADGKATITFDVTVAFIDSDNP